MKSIKSIILGFILSVNALALTSSFAAGVSNENYSDAKLNGNDLKAISAHLLGKENITADYSDYADMNGDGSIDSFDLVLMRQSLIKGSRELTYESSIDQLYSGFTDEIYKADSWNFVVRSVNEMKRYLNIFFDKSVAEKYASKYNDAFFSNSVLLLNPIYQSSGDSPSVEIKAVDYDNGTITVSMNKVQFNSAPDVISALIVQVAIPKEEYYAKSVKWQISEEVTPPPIDPPVQDKNKKIINVSNILQNPELPTGCEVTSLTILLNHLGYSAEKVLLARNYLPKLDFYWKNGIYYGADFRTTFAGNPESEYSYGCYAPCITTTANSYLKSNGSNGTAYNITGADFDSLLTDYIDNDIPVLIWITSSNLHETKLTSIWTTPAGESVQWLAYEHCVVLTGYDKDKSLIYVSDPLIGNTSYDYSKIKQRYIDMGRQSVYIKK